MFFTNHLLAGAVIGGRVKNPASAFAIGVGSHLAMDAMPHWGTDSRTKLLSAACKDGLLSLAFMGHVLSRKPRAATLSCMAGAALLDLRLPLKVLFNVSPFPAPVNRIHDRVQSGRQRPERLKIELAVGASLLALFVLEERTAAAA